MFLAGLGARIGFTALYESRISHNRILGSISGFVKDPAEPWSRKRKSACRTIAGLERQATTNDSGYYTVTNIPAGMYAIRVEVAGFKKYESTDNKLDPSGALSAGRHAHRGRRHRNRRSTGHRAWHCKPSRLPCRRTSPASRSMPRIERAQPDLHGEPGPRHPRRQPGRPVLRLQPGPEQHQRRPHAGKPDHLRRRACRPYPLQRHQPRLRRRGFHPGDPDPHRGLLRRNTDAPPAARSASFPRRRHSSSTARLTTTSATTSSTPTPGPATTPARRLQFDGAASSYNQFGYNIGGPFYIPGKFNKDKNKIFWYWGQEWVRYRFTDTSSQTVPYAADAPGRFQRTAATPPTFTTAR